MPMQHRQQHGQAILIQPEGDAARIGHMTAVDQRLHLHQHRPGALPGRHHHAARHRFLGAGEEDRRRVGDFLQALVGHAEHTQLVDRAEAVLHRTQQSQTTVGLALEIQHRIDHVLKHARPGQRTFLGHMADEEDRRAALLGVAHQQRRAFTHLGHATGRGLQLLGEDGLDRIDHHHLGLFAARGVDDRLDAGLGHDLEPAAIRVELLAGEGRQGRTGTEMLIEHDLRELGRIRAAQDEIEDRVFGDEDAPGAGGIVGHAGAMTLPSQALEITVQREQAGGT